MSLGAPRRSQEPGEADFPPLLLSLALLGSGKTGPASLITRVAGSDVTSFAKASVLITLCNSRNRPRK